MIKTVVLDAPWTDAKVVFECEGYFDAEYICFPEGARKVVARHVDICDGIAYNTIFLEEKDEGEDF